MRYTVALMIALMFILTGCSNVQDTDVNKSYGGAPKIMLNGEDYFASELSFLKELPEEFKYAGKLTEESLSEIIRHGGWMNIMWIFLNKFFTNELIWCKYLNRRGVIMLSISCNYVIYFGS